MVVEKGIWRLYPEEDYIGDAIELDNKDAFGPGEYDFKKITDQIGSIELADPCPPHITLYPHWRVTDNGIHLTDSSRDISAVFPEGEMGLSSFTVHVGRWKLYTEADYQGEVVSIRGTEVFGPGRYVFGGSRDARKFNDKTVSVKLIYN